MANLGGERTNSCLANFNIKISAFNDNFVKPSEGWESIDGTHIIGDLTNFTMFRTGGFVLFRSDISSSYVSQGKCEKMK
jgi:hypothetical protein